MKPATIYKPTLILLIILASIGAITLYEAARYHFSGGEFFQPDDQTHELRCARHHDEYQGIMRRT